jgi:hypothetical protein
MTPLRRIATPICLLVSIAAAATAAAATTPTPPDLPKSYVFTPEGRLTPLRTGVTHRASQFPLPIRIAPPVAGWSGAQWRSGSDYFRGGAPPNFGWVHLGRGSTNAPPQGLVTIMTAYARTPSVAATVNVLRTRGRGASYDATSPAEFAGFAGVQFDGRIVGPKNRDHIGHFFIPFSPRSHAAKYYPDEYPVYGDVFRVIVLDVRGKTVVVFVENAALPEERFPAFLEQATRLLESLRFPG